MRPGLIHWVIVLFLFDSIGFCEWIYFQNHLHSSGEHTYSRFPDRISKDQSYSSEGIKTLMDLAQNAGVGSIAITDHNTISHWFDPVFQNEKDTILISAEEWTNMFGGHASLLGFSAESENDAIVPSSPRTTLEHFDYEEMVQATHDRGGLVSINHPKSLYFPHRWPNSHYNADGVELNFSDFMQPQATIDWWRHHLITGKRLFLLGGSDYHVGSMLGGDPFSSTNLVWVEEKNAFGVLNGIREGRIQVLRSQDSSRLSSFHALGLFGVTPLSFTFGDHVELNYNQRLILQIEVAQGLGSTLSMWNRKGKIKEAPILLDSFFYLDEYISDGLRDFIYFEITDEYGSLDLVANPLYIN